MDLRNSPRYLKTPSRFETSVKDLHFPELLENPGKDQTNVKKGEFRDAVATKVFLRVL